MMRAVLICHWLALISSVTDGFLPMNLFKFSFTDSSLTHQDITKQAWIRVAEKIVSDHREMFPNFNSTSGRINLLRAVKQLLQAVTLPDLRFWDYKEEDHVDNESFDKTHEKLLKDRKEIIDIVAKDLSNLQNARKLCGMALHTVQDFYSHSNWVELGENITHPWIGKELDIDQRPGPMLAGPLNRTCVNCIEGSTCPNNNFVDRLETLTSGFFTPLLTKLPKKPEGKCSHGGFLDASRRLDAIGGINKDKLSADHGSYHPEAARLALEASIEFIESIGKNLTSQQFSDFLGLTSNRTLCFALGLSGDISGALQSIQAIAGLFNQEPFPVNFVLPLFDLPGFGSTVFQAFDLAVLTPFLNALSVLGSLDLSVIAMYGLEQVLGAVAPGTECLLFADGPAGDAFLFPFVVARALEKNLKINVIMSLSSSRRRRSLSRRRRDLLELSPYKQLAQMTGGSFMEIGSSDLAAAASLIMNPASDSKVTIFAADSVSNQFTFTVDTSVTDVSLQIESSSSPITSISIKDPTGSTFTSFTTSVNQANFKVYNLGHLSVGQWSVVVSNGEALIDAKVTATSDTSFTYSFANEIGGVHPGFLPQDGIPLSGEENYRIIVDLTDGLINPGSQQLQLNVTSVLLLSDNGSLLESLDTIELEPMQRYAAYPSAIFDAFRVVIRGVDGYGNTFVRYSDMLVRPSPISIQVSVDVLESQSDAVATVNITNFGPSGTFTVRINDTLSFYTGNQTIRISLEKGEWKLLSLPFSARASASTDSKDDDATVDSKDDDDSESPQLPTTSSSFGNMSTATVTVGGDTPSIVFNYNIFSVTLRDRVSSGSANCQVNQKKGSCSSQNDGCSSSTWTVHFHARDKSFGLRSIAAKSMDPQYILNVNSFKSGTKSNVNSFYTSTCCYRNVEILLTNSRGDVTTCKFSAAATEKPVYKPPSKSEACGKNKSNNKNCGKNKGNKKKNRKKSARRGRKARRVQRQTLQ